MSEFGISEYDAKKMLADNMSNYFDGECVQINNKKSFSDAGKIDFIKKNKLVAKVDQLIGARNKYGLVYLNKDWKDTEKWIKDKMKDEIAINGTKGKLKNFIVEKFVPHDEEYFLCFLMTKEGDKIFFSEKGGVDIEKNWDDVVKSMTISVLDKIDKNKLKKLLSGVSKKYFDLINNFILESFEFYRENGFIYLEFNPIAPLENGKLVPLDVVAKLDSTAGFENIENFKKFSSVEIFGKKIKDCEKEIMELDSKSGASLKLTVLNENGRIWTMVAGGGASVVYADTISDIGFQKEMATYGEYSGNPTMSETHQYAKKVIDLMLSAKCKEEKYLLIGGGIANFTDVAKTFTGIIKAIEEKKREIKKQKINIFIRRGGPNHKQGLEDMRKCGKKIGINIKVFGPEAHMTKIVSMVK